MIERVLFRAVFAGYILIQVVLFLALWALISAYWPSDVLIAIFFIGLFPIGAGSYRVFQRFTRVESVRIEAEKWLAERARAKVGGCSNWRRIVRRWSLWAPTLIVIGACSFLGETFAVASHMFHPGSSKILRYQVSIPLSWIVTTNEPDSGGNHTWSLVAATRIKGTLRAGLATYLRRTPALSISDMAFYGAPSGDPLNAKAPEDPIVSTRTRPFGKDTITCWEYIPRYWREWGDDPRFIRCSTPRGDFFGYFSGDNKGALDFYRTLESVKQIE